MGANFFIDHRILIDLPNRRLLDNAARPFLGRPAGWPTVSGLHRPSGGPFEALMLQFPDLFVQRFAQEVRHQVRHHIQTNGPPVHARARRLDGKKLAAARAEFRCMEDMGIIRRSNSPWASPLHVVPKPDGSWRPCGDYRRLNAITEDDRYPLPHIQDFNANLVGRTVFSVIDLVRGFHQIPMAEQDIAKTALITPFGLFEFVRMPFGLKNAAQAFQRMMDGILRGLDFLFIYLDDILVASKSIEEHTDHLRTLFRVLSDQGITVNRQKCRLGLSEVSYLGHLVTSRGIRPLADRVTAIHAVPPPETKVALQRYLGMLNYYRRFMPGLASTLDPLHSAVGTAGRSRSINWDDDCARAFSRSKEALSRAVLLHHPAPTATTALTVDASDVAIGAELAQLRRGAWVPIAFFSRKLQAAQVKYSAFDRELLAMYLATRHFRHFLEGRPFTIYTDHKPLTCAMNSSTDRSPRQTRHLSYIAEFTADVRHIRGKDNIVADTLSRAVDAAGNHNNSSGQQGQIAALSLPVTDPQKIASLQDEEELQFYLSPESGIVAELLPFQGAKVWCDTSTGRVRPIVPAAMARDVFHALHDISHSGPRPTTRAIADRYVWKGMKRDIREWCRRCHPCQSSKVARHTKAPLEHFPAPDRRFGSIHVDLVGPLPPSEGMTYIFTIIDRYSRWPEAIPISDCSASTCSKALVRHWISRFGVPDHVISDRGAQFTSALWKELATAFGIHHHTTTAYHPQANGIVERFHRHLKGALRARVSGPAWMDQLPIVLLGIRSAWREDADTTPAQLVYGTALRLPGEMVPDAPPVPEPTAGFVRSLQEYMRRQSAGPFRYHSAPKSHTPKALETADSVYIRHDGRRLPLQRPYDGPFAVLHRAAKSFIVNRNGKPYSVSVDRLKPASLPTPSTATPTTSGPPNPTPPPTVDVEEFYEAPLPLRTTTRSGRISKPPERYC